MNLEVSLSIKLDSFNLKTQLNLPMAGISALFGPSGGGKTTLLRAIAGLDKHPHSYVKFGETIWQDETTFVPPHQRNIAYVFQEASLFEHLNVEKNLQYGFKRLAVNKQKVSLKKAINLLEIDSLLTRMPALLSGGERQRVAIARALVSSPDLLIMDEPLASLDQKRKQEILPYLESLNHELDIPILYVSHSTDELARLADYVILLKKGEILGEGTIHSMLTRLDLPLAHRQDAEALIESTVTENDLSYNLASLEFSGGHFVVASDELTPGSKIRLRIAASDVSITLERQSNTSILNIFPATIEELTEEGSAQMLVRLSLSGTSILARVTKKSAANLNLYTGKSVYAQVKTVAVLA